MVHKYAENAGYVKIETYWPLHSKNPVGTVPIAIWIIEPTGLLICCGKDELTTT